MAHLTKRKSKHPITKVTTIMWYIRWIDKVTNKDTWESTHCRKRDAAEIVFRKWKHQKQTGCNPNILLSELIGEVLKYVKMNVPNNYSQYVQVLRSFLRTIKDKPVKLVNVSDIEYYKSIRGNMFVKVNPERKVSPVTINKEIGCIKSAFNKAVDMELISENKLLKVKLIKTVTTNKRETFTQFEKDLILSNIKHIPVLRTTIIALNTGMRLNEILNVQIKDIDFDKQILSIKNKPEINFKTKTSQERTIPIYQTLINHLQDWTGELNNPDSFVINYSGNKYRMDTISHKFVKHVRKLGIYKSIHSCRHTFISELITKGIDIQTVKELAGHSRIQTTAIYMHSNSQAKKDAVAKLV